VRRERRVDHRDYDYLADGGEYRLAVSSAIEWGAARHERPAPDRALFR
jgi:hypothetical protein